MITEVVPNAVVAEHNSALIRSGDGCRWDLLVLPEMIVSAVNNIEDDVDKMMTEITTSQDPGYEGSGPCSARAPENVKEWCLGRAGTRVPKNL